MSGIETSRPQHQAESDKPGAAVVVRRATRGASIGAGAGLGIVIVLALLPYIVSSATVFRLINLLLYIALATMWNLLAGFGGMVSVGQQAYIGLGAYGLVYFADTVGINAFAAVPVAAVVAGIIAIPVSYVAFRLVGGYFAIGTWVIAEVARLLTVQVDTLGGGSGVSVRSVTGLDRVVRIAFTYWLALAVAVLAVAGTYLLLRSRLGLALTAIRDEPTAAAGLGIDVDRAKRIVFVVAALGCGALGAVLALATLRVQPASVYGVQWSAFAIFMVVIGGAGRIEGPILGAIVFYVVQETLADYDTWYLVLLGSLAIAVILIAPRGLWGLVNRELFPVGYRADPPR